METHTVEINRSKAATETIRQLTVDCLGDVRIQGILLDQLKEFGFERRAYAVENYKGLELHDILYAVDAAVRKQAGHALHQNYVPRSAAEVVLKARTLLSDPEPWEVLEALRRVDLRTIEVIDPERLAASWPARAEQVRRLFRQLKIPGMTATTRHHLSEVEIRYRSSLDGEERSELRSLVEPILLRAFPNTEDRSDPFNDYYDDCWTFLMWF